jgi:hypothetical protein
MSWMVAEERARSSIVQWKNTHIILVLEMDPLFDVARVPFIFRDPPKSGTLESVKTHSNNSLNFPPILQQISRISRKFFQTQIIKKIHSNANELIHSISQFPLNRGKFVKKNFDEKIDIFLKEKSKFFLQFFCKEFVVV